MVSIVNYDPDCAWYDDDIVIDIVINDDHHDHYIDDDDVNKVYYVCLNLGNMRSNALVVRKDDNEPEMLAICNKHKPEILAICNKHEP